MLLKYLNRIEALIKHLHSYLYSRSSRGANSQSLEFTEGYKACLKANTSEANLIIHQIKYNGSQSNINNKIVDIVQSFNSR